MDDEFTDAEAGNTGVTKREGHASERAVAAAPADLLARGTAVGRYIVLDVIGEGGMGVVYAAYDPELDRKVAVKLLQARPSEGSTGDQAWLLREAQAMARLSHPNVIAVYDVGSLPGDRVFVAMELVEGPTLRDWVKVRKWHDVLQAMLEAGAGLAAAHAAGLVHRDFKPDNVLVGNDGRVRVLDFGLARLHTADDTPASRESDLSIEARSPLSDSLTAAGTVVGTPAYMAPEIYDGKPADARTDQFAFGVALYEALYKSRPFAKRELADRSATPKPKPPPDVGVPQRIQRAVMRAIAVDPLQRFPSMNELLVELAVDPGAARRRVLVGVGIGLVAVALVGGIVGMSRSRSELCKGADKRLAGVWDPATKQTVRAAFVATKQPFAVPAYAGLERALDGYVADWTGASVEACEATRIRGEQSEEAMGLRVDCLDARLDELHALSQLLQAADAKLVEQGDKVVWGLEPVKKCSNLAELRAPNQPPPALRGELADIRSKLAEAKAALLAGRYLPALVASQAALDRANALKFDSLGAEALVVHAATLTATGNAEDSFAAFTDAAWAAIRGRRDDLAAGAALSSAIIASESLGRPAEARMWLGLGRALSTRVTSATLDKQRLQTEGVVAAGQGDLTTAVAAHEKALAVAIALHGAASPAIWADEEMLATSLSKAGAYPKSLPHFEHALALREASVGPDHPEVALILSNLGTVYDHVGDAAKARAVYERALAIRERTYGATSPMLLATLNNMADTLHKTDPAAALAFIERALKIAERIPGKAHPLYHTIATTYGEILAAAGRRDDARTAFDDVLALEDKAHSPMLETTLVSRAELALDEGKWAEAAAFDGRAIAILEHDSGKDDLKLWRPLTGLGRAKLGLGQPAEARPLLERALVIGGKAQVQDAELAPTREALARAK